jgi:CheY-like chemotaxis protein
MTSEMVFDCLLVSQNVDVLRPMHYLLELLSIRTRVCMTPWRALDLLPTSHPDLIVLDWDLEDSGPKFLQKIRSSGDCKPTIVAISAGSKSIPGAHVVVPTPLTLESGAKSLGLAYAKMLYHHRRHARFDLMVPVTGTDQNHREISLTITNIGKAGVRLRISGKVEISDRLIFEFLLPGARKGIHVEARVLWLRQDVSGQGLIAGCEFVRIPPVDADILDEWCNDKCKVKKPVSEATLHVR